MIDTAGLCFWNRISVKIFIENEIQNLLLFFIVFPDPGTFILEIKVLSNNQTTGFHPLRGVYTVYWIIKF